MSSSKPGIASKQRNEVFKAKFSKVEVLLKAGGDFIREYVIIE